MNNIVTTLIDALNEKKGEDIIFIDIEPGKNAIADQIIVASATNPIHLKAMVESIRRCYKINRHDQLVDLNLMGISGTPESRWVILDFCDLIVHVIQKDLREQYDFDNLFAEYTIYRYH